MSFPSVTRDELISMISSHDHADQWTAMSFSMHSEEDVRGPPPSEYAATWQQYRELQDMFRQAEDDADPDSTSEWQYTLDAPPTREQLISMMIDGPRGRGTTSAIEQHQTERPSFRDPWEIPQASAVVELPEHTEMSVPLGGTRRRYVAEEGEKKECCICSDEYISGDVVRTLHCTHEFHADCVDRWLHQLEYSDSTCTCPYCRAVVNMESLDFDYDSDYDDYDFAHGESEQARAAEARAAEQSRLYNRFVLRNDPTNAQFRPGGVTYEARADDESRLYARYGSDWREYVEWTQPQGQAPYWRLTNAEDRRQRGVGPDDSDFDSDYDSDRDSRVSSVIPRATISARDASRPAPTEHSASRFAFRAEAERRAEAAERPAEARRP